MTRRALLASGAVGGVVATAGCADLVDRLSPGSGDQLSVTITAVPDDDDRQVNGIFSILESNLETVGIDVRIDLRSPHDFHEQILMENDFDMYVGHHPGGRSLDYLYTLCHSAFENDPGWQNPFGLTNIELDELLELQRSSSGSTRRDAIDDILHTLLVEKPFVPICEPIEHRLVNPTSFEGWIPDRLDDQIGYLDLEPIGSDDRLTGTVTDARPTQNVNPLAVYYRRRGTITSLLYDSLGVYLDGTLTPWLASDWDDGGDAITVELRPNSLFHDGEPVTADDVVFTYDLLADLSLGRTESPVPSPRFRRERSLVESIEEIDASTVELTLDTRGPHAPDALTIPILPKHVWQPVVTDLDEETASTEEWLREELLSDDVDRIGSGPYQYESRSQGDRLTLTRFDEHFTLDEWLSLPEPTVPEIRVRNVSNSPLAVDQVDGGSAAVTMYPLESHAVPDQSELEQADLISSNARSFYHVGFNVRRWPFTNPHFRRAVASLIDREWIVSSVFDGHAEPISVPRSDRIETEYDSWDGSDPETPFVGEDGELDESAARDLFADTGLRYDESGRLVVNH
ncbi:ABC transporter substrate-binding protein [Halovivax gelatinilyticus]|uniref:ABC transporter substrate-binding protein n=1 Tax=Halovivax gelatinilyticus TaxID=2961597 RepID=UPI0020CA607E|nr:ABC transporter substrate-binding protein [Halovivax gelatinilyticus]